MPTNLYGPNDNYDLNNSYVIPALIKKFHEAKIKKKNEVVIWGTGRPLREFMHVDDLADACLFLMKNYSDAEFVNVGSGIEVTVEELALKIKNLVAYTGTLSFDSSKPDGTPRKLMSTKKLELLGWTHRITLEEGLRRVIADYPHAMNQI